MKLFTTITVAALAATGIGMAAPAHAGNWICEALDVAPTQTTVVQIVKELIREGYTADNGGPEVMAQAIVNGCPEYIGLVHDTANNLSSQVA